MIEGKQAKREWAGRVLARVVATRSGLSASPASIFDRGGSIDYQVVLGDLFFNLASHNTTVCMSVRSRASRDSHT